MALSSAIGTFLWQTSDTATSTIAVTGVGFTPKAVFMWCAGEDSATDAVGTGDVNVGIGAMTAATERHAVCFLSEDNSTTVRCSQNSAACFVGGDSNGNDTEGLLDFSSFDADGFTVVVDRVLTGADRRISFVAWGGSDLTNAKVDFFVPSTGTGNKSETGVGFQPDVLLVFGGMGQSDTTGDQSSNDGAISFGVATASTERWAMCVGTDDTVPSDTGSYCRGDEVFVGVDDDAPNNLRLEADFVSFDADGFTVNYTTHSDTDRRFMYLAMKGGQWHAGDDLTRTDTNDIAITGAGFQPEGTLIGSVATAESASGTPTSNMAWTMGAAASTTDRVAHGAAEPNNENPRSTLRGIEYDAVYQHIAHLGTNEALMDLKSLDSDGATFVMDDTEPSIANFFGYLFWASDAVVGANPKGPLGMPLHGPFGGPIG